MALSDIDDLPDNPSAGQSGHRQAHQKLHSGLKSVKAELDGRLSRQNTVVIVGSSTTAMNWNETSTLKANDDRGYWTWAAARLGQRFKLLKNAGVGGERTDQILSRISADVAPYQPSLVIEAGSGNNDIIQNIPVSTIKANKQAIWDAIRNTGAQLVTTTLNPYDAATSGQKSAVQEINMWIKSQAVRQNIIVVDFYSAVADPTTGLWLSGFALPDGIHGNRKAAARWGKLLADAISSLFPPSDRLTSSNIDPYNILSNGMLVGNSSGLATGLTHLTLSDITGTATPTKVSRTDGKPGEWQRMVVGAGNSAQGFKIRANNTTGFSVGDEVYAECEIAMGSDIANFQYLTLTIAPYTTGLSPLTPIGQDQWPYQTDVIVDSVDRLGTAVLRTPTIIVPATTGRLMLALSYKGEGTIDTARWAIRNKTIIDGLSS